MRTKLRNFLRFVIHRSFQSTGCEISSKAPKAQKFSETSNEFISIQDFKANLFKINDDDMNITVDWSDEKNSETNLEISSISSKLTLPSESISSFLKRRSSKRKSSKSNPKTSKITQTSTELLQTSPWLTETESISQDISIEQKNLIRFYVNPLIELPDAVAVG